MLQNLKRWLRFRRHDDAYAPSQEAVWNSVREAIFVQMQRGKAVWLVSHFPDTFLRYQDLLDASDVEYEIAQSVLHPAELSEASSSMLKQGTVHLVLSPLIPEFENDPERTIAATLAMLVVERHPLIDHDQKIHRYCKRLGATVELGYFQAFSDPIVASELNDMTLLLMQQMGLSDHSLINSMTLTRRIERKLKQKRRRYQSDLPADNLAEWYELNS